MGLLAKLFGGENKKALPAPRYSNDAVIARIEREEGVDRETARAWFGEMLVFLDLCAGSGEVLSPPKDVDRAWHAFLLHSRDYEAYCRERFGRLIHHQPTDEPDPEAYRRAYARRTEYGAGNPADAVLWTVPVGVSSGDEKQRDDHRGNAGGGSGCGGASAYGDSKSSDGGGSSGGGDSSGSDAGSSCGSSCGGGGCGGGS